jgi:hypothetical protein
MVVGESNSREAINWCLDGFNSKEQCQISTKPGSDVLILLPGQSANWQCDLSQTGDIPYIPLPVCGST